ncbi:PRC-barrel domain-containing protein [Streptomyces ficellus]|uniref:PRC-barrel domain containing protein n=1 Tax=Streptomyces ficellus TaxID=1977088 RepID=A0A6I6FF16_9ACTN|nr:PRC-barrel domain-containing protein [Streptomyces ficellus]QGV77099.1 PRC-barrel domain containing protein [Streptomyces ficellus]
MAGSSSPILKKITDTDRTVASADEDVRGRKVKDAQGNDLGEVADLLVDEEEGRVRFLLVEHGGFLGIGEKKSFIPVDAVARVDEEELFIDQSKERVAQAPAYDPALVEARSEPEYYDQVYAHYGLIPFWGAGYVPPGFPHQR